MRLKNYITEWREYEKMGRGKEIALHQAIRIAPQFSNALTSGTVITRTIARLKPSVIYYSIDPKSGTRASQNTGNYYTLIMDNSTMWKKYPKRSKSVVCSINGQCGSKFPYRVFPKNGSKIGVCKENDLWFSFRKSFDMTLDLMNNTLEILFNLASEKVTEDVQISYDKSLPVIKNACKRFDKWFENIKYDKKELEKIIDQDRYSSYYSDKALDVLSGYNGDLYTLIETKLSPEKNGFKLITTSNLNVGGAKKEMWTDGECLMVRCDTVDNFFSMLYSSGQL